MNWCVSHLTLYVYCIGRWHIIGTVAIATDAADLVVAVDVIIGGTGAVSGRPGLLECVECLVYFLQTHFWLRPCFLHSLQNVLDNLKPEQNTVQSQLKVIYWCNLTKTIGAHMSNN